MSTEYDDPFKLRVQKALTALFKQITPANGYKTDLSDMDVGGGITQPRVQRGRQWFGDNDPLPILSILEGTDPEVDPSEAQVLADGFSYDWPLLVQGFIEDDRFNPTDAAYQFMADVRKILKLETTRTNGISNEPDPLGMGRPSNPDAANVVIALSAGPGVVRPADDISAKAFFWLTLRVKVFDNALCPNN